MFTIPSGLRSRAASSAARSTASQWKGAIASGRQRAENVARGKQVPRYRLSKPELGQTDVESQPGAATAQPVLDSKQQLEASASATDLSYELQQSQERLRMAKALGLDQAVSQQLLAADWPPTADTADSTLDGAAADSPTIDSVDSNNSMDDGTVVFRFESASKVEKPAPKELQQQAAVVQASQVISSSTVTTSTQHAADSSPTSNGATSSGSGVLGWGIAADALVQASYVLRDPLPPTAHDAAVAVSSAVATSVPAQPQHTDAEYSETTLQESAAAEMASKPQRIFSQEQLQVVQLYWARAPNGDQPQYFYMPDPLAVPCKLEVSRSLELELPYDDQLVQQMWQEAERVADADREAEETKVAEAEDSSDDSVVSSSSESSVDGDGGREGQATSISASSEAPEKATSMTALVEFRFHCQTKPGERLWLVGDHPGLGSWNLQKAVKLKWSEGHVWQAAVELPLGTKAAYKAVLQLANQQYKWQSGTDFQLEVTGNMQTPRQEFK